MLKYLGINKADVRKNNVSCSVVIFLVIFVSINYFKPNFLYNNNGTLRQFGIGYKKKTILPCWVMAICLAILTHLFVLWYIKYCS